MDIKSKNKIRLIVLMTLFAYIMGLLFLSASDILSHTQYLSKDYYFNSYHFENELERVYSNIKLYYIDYKDYGSKTGTGKISEDKLKSIDKNYAQLETDKLNNIDEKYSSLIEEASKGTPGALALILQQKDKEIALAKTDIQYQKSQYLDEVLRYRDKEYAALKKSLASTNLIIYSITNQATGEVYTNDINKLYLKPNAAATLYRISFPDVSNQTTVFSSLNHSFSSDGLKGYFIIPKGSTKYNYIAGDMTYYSSIRNRIICETVLCTVCLAAACILFYYLYIRNKSLPVSSKLMGYIKAVPLDIRLILLFISAIIFLSFYINVVFFRLPVSFDSFIDLSFSALLSISVVAVLRGICIRFKNPSILADEWKASLISRFTRLFKESLDNKSILFKTIIILIATMFVAGGGVLFLYGLGNSRGDLFVTGFIICGAYLLIVPAYILRRIRTLNSIMAGTEEIISGNLDYTIQTKGKGDLVKLASNINSMRESFKEALSREMKSERFKSELITNVSHDLKTPLTSIVNYIELLKKEDLTHEEIKDYIGILDRKSSRLRVLIEDLFEASKMASGSVELNIEKVDVTELLSQASAEFDEKINASDFTFKFDIPQKKLYSNLDGKKIWRVFENLINNALKYSQPGTRVYVSLEEEENRILFIIKNISNYEMDFNSEEIFERFKRGDKSRNTEGSGLGLNIAKSIMDLHGGSLDVEIDGDLFKAIVTFPKAK